MNLTNDSVDLYWTVDGDLFFKDEDADVGLADADQNAILEGSIMRRLQSNIGDWRDQPEIGCNLSEFMGMPNTAETAALITDRIISSLTADDLVKGSDLNVDVVPIATNKILILLEVKALEATLEGDEILIGFTYDMRDNRMIPRMVGV